MIVHACFLQIPSERTKCLHRANLRLAVARLLGCKKEELHVLFDQSNTCVYLKFDKRVNSNLQLDSWV